MNIISNIRMLFRRRQGFTKYNNGVLGSIRCEKYNVETKASKIISEQREFINTKMECNSAFLGINWNEFKESILSKQGDINHKNINAILLKQMISFNHLETALLFAEYLKENLENLNLGTINALLRLYYVLGLNNKLKENDRKAIMYFYNYLNEKYKVLEPTTCESLLRAVCVIDEWEIGLKLLDDIFYIATPSGAAFSGLIASLFRNNKESKALELVQKSTDYERPLQYYAYDEWIKFILRNFKQKGTKMKQLENINMFLMKNNVTISKEIAELFKNTYESLNCDVEFTKINRIRGQCSGCKNNLVSLGLTTEEFSLLQSSVKGLIVGSDLFQKSSPEELKTFHRFIEHSGPFDIVLDALNILYGSKMFSTRDKIRFLNSVVDYFLNGEYKILLLGRKHMMKWSKMGLSDVLDKTKYFFTEDLSQDDPYLISAAILSGPQTEFLSKDILRNHKFRLSDVQLRNLFQRWQWERQWMVFTTKNKTPYFKPPLKFTPIAQKIGKIWHIPYEDEVIVEQEEINDGIPDLNSWMCIRFPDKT